MFLFPWCFRDLRDFLQNVEERAARLDTHMATTMDSDVLFPQMEETNYDESVL